MMQRSVWLFLAGLVATAGCQGIPSAPSARPQSPAAPASQPARRADQAATLPAEALLSLEQLPPRLTKPADSSDADKLSDRAAELARQAQEDYAARRFAQAAEKLDRARAFDPHSPLIQRQLGVTYAALGDAAKAEAALKASLADAPDHALVQMLLGAYAAAQRNNRQANVYFRQALLCSDAGDDQLETAETLYRLAVLLETQGYLTASAQCHARLAGLLLTHDRQYAASDRAVLRGLVAQPQQQMLAQGRVLLKLGKVADGAGFIEKAYRRDKSNPQAARLVVKALLQKGDYDGAQTVLTEMLQEPALREGAAESAVEFCRERKDPRLPYRLLEAYAAQGGSDSDFILAMIEVASELGSTQRPDQAVARFLGSASQQGSVALRLARMYARLGDAGNALAQLSGLFAANAPELVDAPEELKLSAKSLKTDGIAAAVAGDAQPAQLAAAALLLDLAGQSDRAVDLFRKAIAGDNRLWAAYQALQRIYQSKNDRPGEDALLEQLKLAEQGQPYYYLKGAAELNRGQYPQARNDLDQARVRLDRHAPTLVLLGRTYNRLGVPQQAEVFLTQAYAQAPNSSSVVREIVELYIGTGRQSEARELVDRFTQANPASLTGRILLARLDLISGNTDKAREEIAALLAQLPDDLDIRRLDLYLELPPNMGKRPIPADKAKAAIERAQALLKLQPSDMQTSRILAALLVNQEQYAQAETVLEKLFKQSPHDVALILAYEEVLEKEKKSDRAMAVLDEWLGWEEQAGQQFAIRARQARLLAQAGQYDKLQAHVQGWLDELAKKPVRPAPPERRGDLQQVVRLTHISVLSDLKAYDQALRAVEGYLAQPLDPPQLALLKGLKIDLLGKQKRLAELTDFGKRWIAQESDTDLAYSSLVLTLAECEKYDEALKLADDWLEAEGKAASATAPATAPAVPDATNIPPLDLQPEKPLGARAAIVRINLLAQRNKVALERARQFAAQADNDTRLLKLLYSALAANELDAETMTLMERIYALDPDDVGINNDLGYSLADRGVQLDRAEEMIRRATEARREVAFLDSLGWVLYKRGKIEQAQAAFDEALDLQAGQEDQSDQEGHALIFDHAGDAYWRGGQADKALQCWKAAVDLGKKQKRPDRDSRAVLERAPAKIQAAGARKPPPVAPLGEGIVPEK
jgi:tetratricopeptide (TPR) repeat protein